MIGTSVVKELNTPLILTIRKHNVNMVSVCRKENIYNLFPFRQIRMARQSGF